MDETTKIVKIRLFPFLVEKDDPFRPGETRLVQRYAVHGQRVSTEEQGDDPNTVYGLRDYDLRRGEYFDAFFTDDEIAAMEAGVTDMETPVESLDTPIRGDTHTSPQSAVGIAELSPGETPHPLTFEEMSTEQLAGYIEAEGMTEDALLEVASKSQEMATKVLNAETLATGGEPREGIQQGVAQLLGAGLPEGEVSASDAALELAEEHGIDISQVTGTGTGGRVTKPDVERYLSES